MGKINRLFENNSLIAAVRDVEQIEEAAKSPVNMIFLMTGDIFTVQRCVEISKKHRKSIFLHVDLIKGVANDKEGIKYLAEKVNPDGIVSTKNHLIHAAKKEGLLTVQHLFVIDSHAYETGIRNILELKPGAIELMPGLMPRVIKEVNEAIPYPVITAGLIKSREEVQEALNAGAAAVAVGSSELWKLKFD